MPVRARTVAFVAALTLLTSLATTASTSATTGGGQSTTSGVAYDTRRPIASARALAVATARARIALGRSLGRMGVFQLDPRTGTARVVARLDGFLTGASSDPPQTVAIAFVRRHLEALGLSSDDLPSLSFAGDRLDLDGVHHLSWTQSAKGIQAFDNGLKASVTPDGRLLAISGSPAHALGTGPVTVRPRVSAAAAISHSRTSVGAPSSSRPGDSAKLVWFHGGRSRLAWQTLTTISAEERDLSVVDASSGAILWRVNLVDNATGDGLAWDLYPGSAVPNGAGVQHAVTFPVKGTTGSRLAGPYAHVYADARDDNVPDPGDEIASMGGLDWSVAAILDEATGSQNCDPAHACTWDRFAPNSWKTNRRQNAVQVYYYLNAFHDHLAAAPIGFTERLGNFQTSNPSGRGKGHDAVQAQIMDGAATDLGLPDRFHYNNANMFTPPDGQAPVMQLYLFKRDVYSPNWPSGNAGDDASVVYHEYTHGLSSRLVTYANGTQALNSEQSGALGEAWSDWYALDFLVAGGVITDTGAPGEVMEGLQITGGDGVRYQAIDCSVGAPGGACPGATNTGPGGFTYGDYGDVYAEPEIHSDGEIWAQTLWDLRGALGVALTERLVTRAMLLSPPDPSFLDMRNAILQADVAYDGGASLGAIWTVFAARGMGYFASSVNGNDVTPTQSFAEPPDCAVDPCGSIHGKITDSVTGKPLSGVVVAIGGHDAGLPGTDLVAKTGADGRYAIRRVPYHTYADVIMDRWGVEPVLVHRVTVNGVERLDRAVTRDWAALDAGATIVRFTRPDYTDFGCGPTGALDRALGSGWGSDAPHSTFGSAVTGPRELVVRLPKALDITSFGVDAGATCGDPASAGVKAFVIYTRTASGPWIRAVRVSSGAVTGRLGTYVPRAGSTNVREVKFVMKSNRGDALFMDMSELSVRGR